MTGFTLSTGCALIVVAGIAGITSGRVDGIVGGGAGKDLPASAAAYGLLVVVASVDATSPGVVGVCMSDGEEAGWYLGASGGATGLVTEVVAAGAMSPGFEGDCDPDGGRTG
jgi:hypothetical protein